MKTREQILVLCVGGAVRSVTLANILKYWFDHDALAASIEKNGLATLLMLCEWADKIVVVEHWMVDEVPSMYRDKARVLPIGKDVWGQSNHDGLIERIMELDVPGVVGVSKAVWEKRHRHFEKWKEHKAQGITKGALGSQPASDFK